MANGPNINVSEPANKKIKACNITTKNWLLEPSFVSFLFRRSLGLKRLESYKPLKRLYSTICFDDRISYSKEANSTSGLRGNEAIFDMKYSLDSKTLIAAGRSAEIILFDPVSHERIFSFPSNHINGTNCIKFIDSRLFCTCSDDHTIAMWDIRNLNTRVNTLKGHTGWVKSLSYMSNKNKIISSGFDDTIRSWSLNEVTSDGSLKSELILNVKFLTRTELSPDLSKLVIATTTGHLFVVHELKLDILQVDVESDLNNILENEASVLLNSKVRKRNKVQICSDFPRNGEPWCISAVKVHPGGSQLLSRYSTSSSLEWTVIHDIHQPKIDTNSLQYYISEPKAAHGYIKTVSYNESGDFICSPYARCIRLLSVGGENEPPLKPRTLTEEKFLFGHHEAPVLTATFAPSFPLLASGCFGGNVAFYQSKF